MSENTNRTTFQYTYSSKEQEEIRKIRSKYVPKEEGKMALLRRLDAQVTQKANLYAIIIGVIGALIMGTGMSCCMVWGGAAFVPGVILGIAGMTMAGLAYPLYLRVLKKERTRIAPEILRLTDELMK